MHIGEKIRELRKLRNITQRELGIALLVSSQAVSKWESGKTTPDIENLPKIAAFFGVSIDDLFK